MSQALGREVLSGDIRTSHCLRPESRRADAACDRAALRNHRTVQREILQGVFGGSGAAPLRSVVSPVEAVAGSCSWEGGAGERGATTFLRETGPVTRLDFVRNPGEIRDHWAEYSPVARSEPGKIARLIGRSRKTMALAVAMVFPEMEALPGAGRG